MHRAIMHFMYTYTVTWIAYTLRGVTGAHCLVEIVQTFDYDFRIYTQYGYTYIVYTTFRIVLNKTDRTNDWINNPVLIIRRDSGAFVSAVTKLLFVSLLKREREREISRAFHACLCDTSNQPSRWFMRAYTFRIIVLIKLSERKEKIIYPPSLCA